MGLKRVMVDAGHGGPPSNGLNYGAAANGAVEKDIVLSIALEMRRLFPSVRLTRSTDVGMSLGQRANIANAAKADVFISLHCNAYTPRPDARGWEIFSASGSSSGQLLAQQIHDGVFPVLPSGWPNRGLKTANYTVLTATKMPAVLLEFGFLTNPTDAAWLRKTSSQTALAQAIGESLGLDKDPTAPSGPTPQTLLASILEDIDQLKKLI